MEFSDSADSFYDYLKIKDGVMFEFQKINIADGDTVVVRSSNVISEETKQLIFLMLRRRVEETKLKNVCLLVVNDGVTIETMDERTMNEIGWYRAGQ